MFEMLRAGLWIGGGLFGLFMVLLALPQSKLRDFLMPIVGWAFAIFCGIYAISPIDLLPEAFLGPLGLFDDAAAAVAGISSAIAASRAGKRLLAN